MRRIALLAVALIFCCSGLGVAQSKPNLTGTWVLDLASSDLGGGPRPAGTNAKSVTLVIKQTADMLTTERHVGDAKPEVAVQRLDGGESVNKTPSGQDVKTKAKWVGTSLVRQSVMEMKGGSTTASEDVMSLSADGKTMTIDVTQQLPRGEVKRKLVYKKQ